MDIRCGKLDQQAVSTWENQQQRQLVAVISSFHPFCFFYQGLCRFLFGGLLAVQFFIHDIFSLLCNAGASISTQTEKPPSALV